MILQSLGSSILCELHERIHILELEAFKVILHVLIFCDAFAKVIDALSHTFFFEAPFLAIIKFGGLLLKPLSLFVQDAFKAEMFESALFSAGNLIVLFFIPLLFFFPLVVSGVFLIVTVLVFVFIAFHHALQDLILTMG